LFLHADLHDYFEIVDAQERATAHMAIFGLNGFVIGPVIAAMFMAVPDIVASSRARAGFDRTGC
jgi:hypothetical protein